MKKTIVLIIFTLFLVGCEATNQNLLDTKDVSLWIGQKAEISLSAEVVQIADSIFKVEIADEHRERRDGLMFRESLAKDAGMLFVFEDPKIYPFWMKNTLIPLQILWISEEGIVVDAQYAIPCEQETCPQYVPSSMAKYVLEILG